ncbi:protein-S-isoprenylcysteine O-methyltransferase [Algihabitans albus]|uniref:protein-S-isoprenylcysteine O-methyltransferase n=1 Tax=Algihabitans albus TaxID=2164067 RepID=UPI0035CFE715
MTTSSSSPSRLYRLASFLWPALGLTLVAAALWRWEAQHWGAFVWLAGSFATGLIRAPFQRRTRDNVVVDDRKTLGERLLLAGMFLTMGILPLLQLATGIMDVAAYSLPTWATAIGAALQVPFLWLFWRSHADLGRNWSVSLEIRKDHNLVTQGVYARMRHPMYAAIWIAAIAQPLLIHNWIAGLLVIPTFAAMYLLRIPQEEAMMQAQFGADYDRYAAQTGRIWPRLGSKPTTAS